MTKKLGFLATEDPAKLDREEIFAHLPANRVGETDRRYLEEVLADGFGNNEPADMTARFERAFAERFGVPYAISFNSGSGTMLACLLAAGIGPGDEVIVPTVTMAATAFVVLQCGAVPVFADCDPETYTIDVADARRKVTEFTRAIMPVSIFGLPADFESVSAIASDHNLLVIEDDAQCFLAYYKDQLVGTIGDAASFSLQGSKHITSGNDGGMVITSNKELATGIRKAAIQGYSALGPSAGSTTMPRDIRQDWEFERHSHMGYNFRISAMQSALGLAQLERMEYLVAARRIIAYQYEKIIRDEGCEWLVPPVVPEGSTHSYWCYTCKLNEELLGVDWRTFRLKFIEHGGDGLYGLWTPVHLEPVFRDLSFYGSPERGPNFDTRYKGNIKSYRSGDCPTAEVIRSSLCLFKTGSQTLVKVDSQLEALQRTIRYYG